MAILARFKNIERNRRANLNNWTGKGDKGKLCNKENNAAINKKEGGEGIKTGNMATM